MIRTSRKRRPFTETFAGISATVGRLIASSLVEIRFERLISPHIAHAAIITDDALENHGALRFGAHAFGGYSGFHLEQQDGDVTPLPT
jgi:hypothetical protein